MNVTPTSATSFVITSVAAALLLVFSISTSYAEPLTFAAVSTSNITPANDSDVVLHQNTDVQQPEPSWETGAGKSYVIPALEIPGFIVLLNAFDRLAFPHKIKEGRRAYNTTPSTIWEHVHRQNWTFDKDSFDVNQFGHPYEGATMYGLARSSGLNFWYSLLYSNVGSFLWEMAGETTRPSINDQITTGNAGSLLGEALFRMAGLALEDGGARPVVWHELAAAVASPPTAFNRHAFGDRFKNVFPSHRPAILWRVSLGGSLDTHSSNLTPVASRHDANAVAAFNMEYGLPGKPGYRYSRPLDYFDFQLATRLKAGNPLETLTVRGLLLGTDYHFGNDYRGIWGLYGSYDYISPPLFRVSSTALSLGTTGQFWVGPGVALQGSVLGGLGFGAAGTETDVTAAELSDGPGHHYGATPQGLVSLKLLFGDRTMFDATARSYYVTELGPQHSPGPQLVLRGSAGVTVRVSGRHAVGIQYAESRRDTYYRNMSDKHFSEGTASVVYTYLSDNRFGAVEWREAADR
jgi:hypothetical protein